MGEELVEYAAAVKRRGAPAWMLGTFRASGDLMAREVAATKVVPEAGDQLQDGDLLVLTLQGAMPQVWVFPVRVGGVHIGAESDL